MSLEVLYAKLDETKPSCLHGFALALVFALIRLKMWVTRDVS